MAFNLKRRLWFDCAGHAELRAWMEKHSPFETRQFFPLLDKDTVQADKTSN